jgi:hypothetical protein
VERTRFVRSASVPKALGEDIFVAGLTSVTRDHPYMKIPAEAKLGRGTLWSLKEFLLLDHGAVALSYLSPSTV